jgi:hypothetical protein
MKKRNIYILFAVLAFAVLAFFIGYFWGKSKTETTPKEVEVVKYLPGKTIHDTLYRFKTYKEIIHDTIDNYIKYDTSLLYSTFLEFNKEKNYKLNFGNDTIGKFDVDLKIQHNELQRAISDFIPIQKVITNTKIIREIPTYQFYGMLGSDFNLKTSKIELGLDYKQKYMFSIAGIRHKQDYFYTINVGLKF